MQEFFNATPPTQAQKDAADQREAKKAADEKRLKEKLNSINKQKKQKETDSELIIKSRMHIKYPNIDIYVLSPAEQRRLGTMPGQPGRTKANAELRRAHKEKKDKEKILKGEQNIIE